MARYVAAWMTIILVGLLGWMVYTEFGDVRTYITMGIGILLGSIYVALGKLPWWISNYLGINENDDPSNISPSQYLPILLFVILLAVAVLLFALLETHEPN